MLFVFSTLLLFLVLSKLEPHYQLKRWTIYNESHLVCPLSMEVNIKDVLMFTGSGFTRVPENNTGFKKSYQFQTIA